MKPKQYSIKEPFDFYGREHWGFQSEDGEWFYSYNDAEVLVGPFQNENDMHYHASGEAREWAADRASEYTGPEL